MFPRARVQLCALNSMVITTADTAMTTSSFAFESKWLGLLTGSAEPNSAISIYDDNNGTHLGKTTTADSFGTWSVLMEKLSNDITALLQRQTTKRAIPDLSMPSLAPPATIRSPAARPTRLSMGTEAPTRSYFLATSAKIHRRFSSEQRCTATRP